MAREEGPRRRSWRDMTQTVFGAGGSGGQRWRSEPRAPRPRKERQKAVRNLAWKAGASLVALGLLGAAFYLIWFIPKTTPVIAISVTDYPAPLPPNAWASEDSAALTSLADSAYLRPVHSVAMRGDKRMPPDELAALEKPATTEKWLEHLRSAVRSGAKVAGQNAVVLYLNLHGVVNDQGEPCLMLAAPATATYADLLNTSDWAPLGQVLEVVEAEAKAKNVNVIVALDAARIDLLWDLGILQNEFSRLAQAEVEKRSVELPHVAVLSAAAPGQLAWASPELGRGVFSYYLEHGLRGGADAEGDGNRFVSLKELHGYVLRHVSGFVRSQFGDEVRQEPALWSAGGGDFQVARCNLEYGLPTPALTPLTRSRAMASVLKQLQGEMNAESVLARQPVAWERRRADVQRLEQLLAAGSAYASEANILASELAGGLDDQDDAQGLQDASVSLALTKRLRPGFLSTYSAQEQQAFGEQVIALAAAPVTPAPTSPTEATPPAADPNAEKKLAEGDAPKAEPPKAGEVKKLADQADPAVRAEFVWRWFITAPRSQEEVDRVLAALFPTTTAPEPPLVELQWIRLLRRDLETKDWQTQAVLIRDLGRLRDESETLTALLNADAGSATSPLDIRVLESLRERVAAAETRRRECEDLTFLFRFDEARGKCAALLAEYDELQALASETNGALADLDRMRANCAPLIAWRCRSQLYDDGLAWSEIRTRELLEKIDLLQVTLNSLPEALATADATTVNNSLRAARSAALGFYTPLENSYRQEATLVLTAAKDNPIPEHLRRLTLLLSVAPLPAGDRAGLLERRDELAAKLAVARPRQSETASSPQASLKDSLAANDAVAASLSGWSLGVKSESTSGAALRKLLAEFAPAQQQMFTQASNWQSLQSTLQKLDADARRAAPFAPSAFDASKTEPAEFRFASDTADFLAWQSERILTDFWGSASAKLADPNVAGDSRSVAEHFFSECAARIVTVNQARTASIAEAKDPATAAVGKTLRAFANLGEEKLSTARKAANAGLAPADGRLPARLFGTITEQVALTPAAGLPAGLAAAWTPPAPGLVVSAATSARQERKVGSAETPAPLAFQFDTAQSAQLSLSLYPTVYYRGHYWRGAWSSAPVGLARTVVYQPPEAVPPQVVVRDPRTDRVAFSVILDCSGSMNPPNGTNRLELAKRALLAALGPVAQEKRHWLSLRLFAHRFNYEPNQQKTAAIFVTSDSFKRQEADREARGQRKTPLLHPNEDIELIQSMSAFDVADLGKLEERLAPIGAFGGTPLYLSIQQALKEDRSRIPQGFRHHILVITDGENQVIRKGLRFTNEPLVADDVPQPSVTQLIEAFSPNGEALHGVKLDIVAILKEADTPGIKELKQLDAKTEGNVVFDPDGSRLVQELRRAIGLQDFHLVDGGGQAISKSMQLGEWAKLNAGERLPLANVAAEVVESGAKSEPFPLLGGEWIELKIARNGGRDALIHERYQERADDPVDDSGAAFIAWALRPGLAKLREENDQITFRATIQDRHATKYLPPPAEAWAEITMPSRDGEAPTYLAYDLHVEPRKPATILDWSIYGFPLQRGDQAQLRVWWRNQPSPTLAELRVGDLLSPDGVRVEAVPGLTLQGNLQGTSLTIEERHDETGEGSKDVPWVRIELSEPPQNIKSITRDFYPQVRGASHRFELTEGAAPSLQSARVYVRELYLKPESSSERGVFFATFPAVTIE